MNQRRVFGLALSVGLVGLLMFASGALTQAAPGASTGKTRTYYIAADEVNWDYAPSGYDVAMGHPFDALEKWYTEPGPHHIGSAYKKAIYREYTDGTFTRLKPRPADQQYLGLVGPILRGEVGDTIRVVFRNHASHPYSMHPHGVLYTKDSEGADYNDNTGGGDKTDGAVPPGGPAIPGPCGACRLLSPVS